MAKQSKRRTDGGYMPATKVKKPLPQFSITEDELPAITGWKVGNKYSMELEVEMVSASKGSEYESLYEEGPKKHTARFKIISVDSEPEK